MNIDEYKGLNIVSKLHADAQKGVYMANWNQLYKNYGDNVEWQKLKNQVLLCDETVDYIYAQPNGVKYAKGSRPVIEMTAKSVTAKCTTDRQRVLSILEFCRDLYLTHGKHVTVRYYGGTEEQLIEKGVNLCEAISRLMVCLLEVLDISARIVMQVVNGHIVTEAFIEGKWCFFDPRFGIFYADENDRLLSVREIMQDRDVIFRQPDWVKKYVSAQTDFDKMANDNYNKYMCPKEIVTFCNYSLMDYKLYTYGVTYRDDIYRHGMASAIEEYKKYTKLVMEG